MTTRPQGYGLSRELAEKNAAKYSVDDEVLFFNQLSDFLKSWRKIFGFLSQFWLKRESKKFNFLCKK